MYSESPEDKLWFDAQELKEKSNAANRGVVYNNINILKCIISMLLSIQNCLPVKSLLL